MARKLVVEIVGDASSLEREFKRSAHGAKQFERQMGRIGGGKVGGLFKNMGSQLAAVSGVTLGAAGVVAGLKTAVNAASDLNEEVSKSKQVFGGSASAVRAWAKDAPEALKTSQREALAAASGFGSMLETAGLAQDKAASMSMTMTQLGTDMASFNNEDPSEMLDRLRSGLAGEAEPLRRFGVLLSEARVAEEAHRMGLVRDTQKLSEQQKVLARYSILMKDTVKQQGDVARTGDAFAGQQRELKARLEDTAAAIGTALLPKVTDVTDKLNKWLAKPRNQKRLAEDTQAAADGMVELADGIDDVVDAAKFLDRLGGSKSGFDIINAFTSRTRLAINQITGNTPTNPKADLGFRQPGAFDLGFRGAVIPGRDPFAGRGAYDQLLAGSGGGGGFVATAKQRARWFDSMISRRLDRVQDVRTLQGQVKALTAIAALVKQRLAKTKDITRRMTLEDELVGIFRDRAGINAMIAANKKEKERLKLLDEAEDLANKRAKSLERLRNAQASARAAFGELGQGSVITGPLMDQLREWGGKPTAADFIADLKSQIDKFKAFQADLATLKRRGVSKFVIDTLKAQGQGGAEEAHALAGATKGQLATFDKMIAQRKTLLGKAAQVYVQSPRVTITAASVSVHHGKRAKTATADDRKGVRGPGKG